MSLYDDILALKRELDTSPRPASWEGQKVAIWDLLIDMGAIVDPDGTSAPIRLAGVDVHYRDDMPPRMVVVRDQHGAVMQTFVQSPDTAKWAMFEPGTPAFRFTDTTTA